MIKKMCPKCGNERIDIDVYELDTDYKTIHLIWENEECNIYKEEVAELNKIIKEKDELIEKLEKEKEKMLGLLEESYKIGLKRFGIRV